MTWGDCRRKFELKITFDYDLKPEQKNEVEQSNMFVSSERTKSSLRTCLIVVAISVAAGGLFGLVQQGLQTSHFLRGALTGALISAPIVVFEVLYVQSGWGRSLREAPVWWLFLTRTFVYTAAILVGELLSRLRFSDASIAGSDVFDAIFFRTFAFTLGAAAIFNFILLTNRLLGKNVLINLLFGRYHRPREEIRIFLFADMVGSTTIAEQLGNDQFLRLLNRCFFTITDPVLHHGGEIYRYVGDEIIVTWKSSDQTANARALECVSAIAHVVAAERRTNRA